MLLMSFFGIESCKTSVLHKQTRQINFLLKESEGILFSLITMFECQQKQHSMQEEHNDLLKINDMQQKV